MSAPRAVTEPQATAAAEHVLFYDAVCPLCTRAVGSLRRRGLLAGIETRALEEAAALGLPAESVEALRSEMLLWSPRSGTAASGFDGFLKLLELQRKWPLVRALFRVPPLRELGRFGYRLTSINRRIFSPPANGGVACACDPPESPRWRRALLAVLLGIAVIGTFLFGLALSAVYHHASPVAMGLRTVLAAGASWGVSVALLAVALPRRRREAFWQGLVAVAAGVLVLVPFALVGWVLVVVSPLAGLLVHIIGVTFASLEMLRSTVRRHRNLGFPNWTPWLWFAGLWLGAAPFVLGWV